MAKRKMKAPALVAMRPQVAGIDVGSGEHWAAGPMNEDGEANVCVFGSTTPQLEKLANWLIELGVESVAMESTYVYWIPLYELLESRGIEVVLVNARQLRNVPGRKTDVSDCQWLQILHSCGLLRGSFRPEDAICQLRALRRQMANLTAERTKCVQWMQKALDQMNVQVHRAVSDLTGKTGMSIVRAIVAGERSPARLAELRDRRCKKIRRSDHRVSHRQLARRPSLQPCVSSCALRRHRAANRLLREPLAGDICCSATTRTTQASHPEAPQRPQALRLQRSP